jgi:hypothetical protein
MRDCWMSNEYLLGYLEGKRGATEINVTTRDPS